MPSKVIMPQGGQDLTTGRIVRWLKKVGDAVKKGETICEVETEKAVFDVPAPQDGVMLQIIAHEGNEVEILSTIGYVGEIGEKIEPITKLMDDSSMQNLELDNVKTAVQQDIQRKGPKLIISPKARKLARDNGLPLEKVLRSRPDGKITTEDVIKALNRVAPSLKIQPPTLARAIPLGKIRKAASRRLSQSWSSAPHIFVVVAVDMTQALELREKKEYKGISINALLIRASALALKEHPEVNASLIDEDTIGIWEDINIGLAVDTAQRLLVPVIEGADKLTLNEIDVYLETLIAKARAGKQDSPKPGRFTISNLGMHQVDMFTAVINPPEAAILAVSTIRKLPQVGADDCIEIRQMMNLTLSMDHRVGDGVIAAKFINAIKVKLENPLIII